MLITDLCDDILSMIAEEVADIRREALIETLLAEEEASFEQGAEEVDDETLDMMEEMYWERMCGD